MLIDFVGLNSYLKIKKLSILLDYIDMFDF